MPPTPEIQRKPKLHELLGVRTSLEQQAHTTTNGLATTFEKKQHLFTGRTKTFTPNGEDAPTKGEEHQDIQTTVTQELIWLKKHVAPWIDNILHIAEGNTRAAGDIILLDGTAIGTDIPTSCLLDYERLVDGLRLFALKIPTIDPAKSFVPAPDRGEGIFAARPIEKIRKEKQRKVITLAVATEKHQAQTQLVEEDVPTGTIIEREWSSMITPAHKAAILARIEELARAIKQARMRANATPVDVSRHIGDAIFRHIFEV